MSDDPIREQSRPSPDALLESAQRETRGHLKIFLGAAPGVGKTYEMLMSGRAQRADGIDVVIGVVETHGRAETEALVEGFEIVPRRTVPYRGHVLDEMDIDAILARKPALVLVDALTRLVPGALGDPDGALDDSHASGLLEYPHYTRPAEWVAADGRIFTVPDILRSGDHGKVREWRREQSVLLTRQRRPDLLDSPEN